MSAFFGSKFKSDVDTAPLHFVVQPSRNLICLICQEVFNDPVISECGHTFCRRCISSNQTSQCPVHCEKPLVAVVDNLAVQEQINELFVKCRFGLKYCNEKLTWINDDDGCSSVIRVADKLTHECQCEYRFINCPNCNDCSLIRYRHLQAHLLECQMLKCHHEKYGCKFVGNGSRLSGHLTEECKFEPLKEFLRSVEERFQEQNEQLQMKDQEIRFLRSVVTKLAEKVNDFDHNLEDLQTTSAKTESDVADLRKHVEELTNDVRIAQSESSDVKTEKELNCVGTFIGHEGPVWCLVGYRNYIFSGSSDSTIKVWDVVNSYECIKTLEGHEGIVLSLLVCENKLYSGSADFCFNVWSLETFSLLRRVQAHDQAVCTMASWNAKVFTGSLKSIKVWDTNNNCSLFMELNGLSHWIRSLFVAGGLLYSGYYQAVMIWNLETYQCIKTLDVSAGNVYGLCFYDNSLYCAESENIIEVINLHTNQIIDTLKGHTGTVYRVAVYDNEKDVPVLLSVSSDKSLRVWSLSTGECLQTLTRHEGSVSCLLIHNNRIYSGAVDSCIKVWC